MISGVQEFQSTTLQNDVVADMKFGELAAGSKSFPDSAVIWRRTLALVPSGLNREGAIWGCVLAPGQCLFRLPPSGNIPRLQGSSVHLLPLRTGRLFFSCPAWFASRRTRTLSRRPHPIIPLIKHTPLKRQGERWLPSGRQ